MGAIASDSLHSGVVRLGRPRTDDKTREARISHLRHHEYASEARERAKHKMRQISHLDGQHLTPVQSPIVWPLWWLLGLRQLELDQCHDAAAVSS
jgi:hypothetical protein